MKFRNILSITITVAAFVMLAVYFAYADVEIGYINSNNDYSGYLNYNYGFSTDTNNLEFNANFILKDNIISSDIDYGYSAKINESYSVKAGINYSKNARIDLNRASLNGAISYKLQTDEYTKIYSDLGLIFSDDINIKSQVDVYYELGYLAKFENTKLKLSYNRSGDVSKLFAQADYSLNSIANSSAFANYTRKNYLSNSDFIFSTGLKIGF